MNDEFELDEEVEEEKKVKATPFQYFPPSLTESEPLGITANFASAQQNQGFRGITKSGEEEKIEAQKERRRLRNKSQKILFKTKKFSRLRSCGKAPVWDKQVQIKKTGENNVYFSGLETCGNSWCCPVCAPRIQYQRGIEIAKAVDKAYKEGYKVFMVTWTHPHYAGQPLKDLARMHNLARRFFKSGRWYQNWSKGHGYMGGITATEVNWGIENGWHWHSHELMFIKNTTRDDNGGHMLNNDEKADFALRWVDSLKRAGFKINSVEQVYDIIEHGIDIRQAHSTDYLVKMGLKNAWGADKEMRGGFGKGGRDADGHRHYTPFELLEKGDETHWIEYCEAVKGLCQIQWTRGLKEWASVEEKSDEQISLELESDVQDVASEQKKEQEQAAEQMDPALLAIVPRPTWYKVLANELREELLEVARSKGKKGIDTWASERGLDIRVPGLESRCMQEFGGFYVCEDDIPA